MDNEDQECSNDNIEGLYYEKLEKLCFIRVAYSKKYGEMYKKSLEMKSDIAMAKVNYKMPPLQTNKPSPMVKIKDADIDTQFKQKLSGLHNRIIELNGICKQMISEDRISFGIPKDVRIVDKKDNYFKKRRKE